MRFSAGISVAVLCGIAPYSVTASSAAEDAHGQDELNRCITLVDQNRLTEECLDIIENGVVPEACSEQLRAETAEQRQRKQEECSLYWLKRARPF